MTLRFPSGQRVREFKPLVIEPQGTGLRVNGRRLTFRKSFRQGQKRGELMLSIRQSTSRGNSNQAMEPQWRSRTSKTWGPEY